MFVELLLGRVRDGDAMRRHWEAWRVGIAPEAPGWMGSTGGITADGRLALSTSFVSETDAAANRERPEQEAWLATIETALDGPPAVLETADVTEELIADPSGAGFVQLMRAGVRDRTRFEAIEDEIGPAFVKARPDFLAGYRLWFGDGTVVALDYFRSEADARAGETQPMPDDLAIAFQEWQSLLEDAEWFDIVDPWLARPA